MNTKYFRILEEINDERNRQDRLKAQGKFAKTCADDMTRAERLSVLAEEYGEVAHEVNEAIGGRPMHLGNLRTELRQVGAVALACIEGESFQVPGRWELLEEINEEFRCAAHEAPLNAARKTPAHFADNFARFESFSSYYAAAVNEFDPRRLRRLAMACMAWIAALEDDAYRAAQTDEA